MDESDFIPRHAANEVIEALTEARIVAILGPRQSGKSTLARSLVERGLMSGFYSLDNEDARDAARLDPRGFLASLTTPAIIDEIQRAPELLLTLKARVDMDTTPGQFLLTGSANLTTLRSVRDALPGRIDYVDLWPFSQGELNRHRERFIDRTFDNAVPMLHDCEIGRAPFAQRIAAGGFPDARTRTPRGRSRYFDSYVRSIFGRDIHDVATGNPQVTEALLRLIAARSSSLANLAELGRAVGVTEKTVAAHLATLEQLLLVRRHRPWSSNLGKRLVKSPRLFVCDTGLACHLCGYDEARLADDGDAAGPMFESFVAMELVRQATWSNTRVQVLHYRDKDQYEIDVILERGDGTVVGIEVKSRATVHPTDFRALTRLRDQLGPRFACGIVINTGPDTLPFGDRMWAVPLSGLWTP